MPTIYTYPDDDDDGLPPFDQAGFDAACARADSKRGNEEPPPWEPNGSEHHQGNTSTIKFLTKADFIKDFRPPDYLIVGVLQRRFIYSLTGQTGHAKTAIALLIAELVASARLPVMLGPHEVKKGRVIYFVGENPDDIRMRVIGADSTRLDDPSQDQICYIPGVFNINHEKNEIANKVQEAGGADLVIIDTSAAYFLGKDEISNTEMGNHARMLRELTKLPGGPCILVLCHPIKHANDQSQLIPRGGGAFLAEMDGNLTAIKHGDVLIDLHHFGKFRGPDFEPMTFKLIRIECEALRDTDGRQIPTVKAQFVESSEKDNQEAIQYRRDNLVLAKMLEQSGRSFSEIADQCKAFCRAVGDPTSWTRWQVENAIKRMSVEKPAVIHKVATKWELTEEGKERARKAAIQFEREVENAAQKS